MCLLSDKPCALAGPSAVAILALLEKRKVEISGVFPDVRDSKVTDRNRLTDKKKEKIKWLGRNAQAKSDKNHQVDARDMI